MSQHDFNLANASGPNFRADANAALAAIATQSAGPAAPSPTFANQFWYDTSTGYLKIRDNANTIWQVLFSLDAGGNITFKPGANDRNVDLRNASDAIAARMRVDSGGDGRVLAEDRNSVQRVMLHGPTTGGKIYLDGDETTGKQVAPTLILGAYSLTGLTSRDVAIPAGATSLQLHYQQVMQPGVNAMAVQLGIQSGIVATGYVGVSGSGFGGGGTVSTASSFPVRMGQGGLQGYGIMTITGAANQAATWVSSHAGAFSDQWVAGGGAIGLSGTLTTLRVLAADAYTAGGIIVHVRF